MNIGILPSKMFRGIRSVHGPHTDKQGNEFIPEAMETLSLEEMLVTSYDTDAHFSLYNVVGEEEWPRLTKPALKTIRDIGSDVVTKYIVMDWDTPKQEGSSDKVPLNEELFDRFITMLYSAGGELGKWMAAYTTRNGGRIIYQLPDPVQVDVMEEYIVGLLYMWKHEGGEEMDPACKDWTRLFRAPMVVRDGVPSVNDTFFTIVDIRPEQVLNINKVMRVPIEFGTVESYDGDRALPMSEEMHGLMHSRNPNTRQTVQTAFYKVAKKELKSTPMYTAVFGEDELCPHGERNNTIGKYLGIAVPKLLRSSFKGLTPQHVLALFYDKLCELEPDAATPCWINHAWNFLLVIWEREIQKYNSEQLEKAAKKTESLNLMDRMVLGMQGWCSDDDIHSEDKETRYEFLRQHCFAALGKFLYPLGPDGEYETFAIAKDNLISRIRKTHLDGIIETRTLTVTGQDTDVQPSKILNEYSTTVEDLILKPQLSTRGIIEDLNGFHPRLVMPMYRRNPNLEPEFNEYVHEWLMHFFGDNFEKGLEWISNALAFEDGPICGLSIKGPGGIGKKLLTTGLVECLEDPKEASGQDIAGMFNGALSSTPFLVVNEGWPSKAGSMSPSDLFKALTAGDPIAVREMYKPNKKTINPMRIIFTANDHDLIYELTGGKNLSPESRKAVGERLLHFDVDFAAGRYLESLGGRKFTQVEGARWIRGDDGAFPSDFVVAKHFLWLYEHRDVPDMTQRYLVMGNSAGSDHAMYDMLLSQQNTANTIKAIVRIMERRHPGKGIMQIDSESGKVFVTVMGLCNYMEEVMEMRLIEVRNIDAALRNISKTENGTFRDGMKWIEIDCSSILNFAENMGMEASVLRGIVNKQLGKIGA